MIVIVAGRLDVGARALAARWADRGARVLTCDDLSSAGWRHRLGAAGDSVAVVGGEPVPVREITGVLTRLARIDASELAFVAPDDHAYVAAEMTAFLLSWLSSLLCPVLNRPTPSCLAGPGWGPERWALAAARVGIPVRPVRRRAGPPRSGPEPPPDPDGVDVTVIGSRAFGRAHERLLDDARRLAASAGTHLLAVRFDGDAPGSRWLAANPWPGLSTPAAAAAAADDLSGVPRR